MVFNIGDKVKINQNHDKERYKYFGKVINYYSNKIGVVEEIKDIKITKMYRIRWEDEPALEIVSDMLIPAEEKYNSIW